MEIEKTIRNCGKLRIIDDITDDQGSRVIRDFLSQLAESFAKRSAKYMRLVQESPFAYSERQSSSLLAPALSEISEAFLMEFPTKRKDRKLDYDTHGWIDFWALFRNIDFYIELKHSYLSYRGQSITSKTERRWKSVNQQVKDCKKDILTTIDSRGFITLPIQIIPIYESRRENESSLAVKNHPDLLGIHEHVHHSLSPSPNWSALWTINEDLVQNSFHYTENGLEYYPALLIVSRFDKLH